MKQKDRYKKQKRKGERKRWKSRTRVLSDGVVCLVIKKRANKLLKLDEAQRDWGWVREDRNIDARCQMLECEDFLERLLLARAEIEKESPIIHIKVIVQQLHLNVQRVSQQHFKFSKSMLCSANFIHHSDKYHVIYSRGWVVGWVGASLQACKDIWRQVTYAQWWHQLNKASNEQPTIADGLVLWRTHAEAYLRRARRAVLARRPVRSQGVAYGPPQKGCCRCATRVCYQRRETVSGQSRQIGRCGRRSIAETQSCWKGNGWGGERGRMILIWSW